MRKTFLLLFSTIIMTAVLCFSGTNLLALVARSDTLVKTPAADNEDGTDGTDDGNTSGENESDGDISIGVPGFSFFKPFKASSANDFVDVLRGFRQDAGDPINVLLLARDMESSNTDAIMVAHFDPKTSQVNIMSVPRDTYVTVPGYKVHKINSVYQLKGGVDLLKDTLKELLGQDIDYYVHLNLKTIREIVDLLDGVEYDVPFNMVYNDPDQDLHINLKQGRRTLTGKQVEGLLRFRYPNQSEKAAWKYYDGSDIKRIERQHDFFNEMLKQKLTIQYLPKISEIISTVYANIETDLPLAEMLKLAKGLPNLSAEKFLTATIPGEGNYVGDISYWIHYENQTLALAEAMLSDNPPTATPTPATPATPEQ